MQSLRTGASGLALLLGLMLAGCSTTTRTSQPFGTKESNSPEWQGRISVQVLGDSPSSMSASFLLRGSAQSGELDLYSPLGTTLGSMQWTPQQVRLSDGNKQQYFNSLAELTEKATGAALPVEALFGWLQGRYDKAIGWQADLSNASEGSLFARRISPSPEVTLRIKLDP